jgi:hypothetical protein
MLIPFKLPFPEVSFRDLLRLSTTKRKTRGDKGHPCIIPLLGLKKGEATPFIRITKEVELIQCIT